jgi:superfamily II DNA or RNA helicase
MPLRKVRFIPDVQEEVVPEIKKAPKRKVRIIPDEIEAVPIDKTAFNPGYASRKTMKTIGWRMLNRNKFQEWNLQHYRYNKTDMGQQNEEMCGLSEHQHMVKDFLQSDSPYRGLLFFHGLGSGKTRAAIAVAEAVSSEFNIVVMLPASLESNFVSEIRQCGNHSYSIHQKWKFVKASGSAQYKKIRDEYLSKGVDAAMEDKHDGIWIVDTDKGDAYKDIKDPGEQDQIKAQLDTIIRKRYKFFRYNGLGANGNEKVANLGNLNNSIVIIDEVHNFISNVVNGSPYAHQIYGKLMQATPLKLIMLTGTPMQNRPYEVACICNLARGYLPSYTIGYKKTSLADREEKIRARLDQDPYIDFYAIDMASGKFTFVPLPVGYAWKSRKDYTIAKNANNVDDFLTYISGVIENELNLSIAASKTKRQDANISLFPSFKTRSQIKKAEQIFNDLFVNYDVSVEGKDQPIKNPNMLMRRMQGIISYYYYQDKSEFPKTTVHEPIKLPMSNHMFNTYMQIRQYEYEKEQAAKKKRLRSALIEDGDDNQRKLNAGDTYRAGSRAVCNFVFPSQVLRPNKSTILKAKYQPEILLENTSVSQAMMGEDENNLADSDNDDHSDSESPATEQRATAIARRRQERNEKERKFKEAQKEVRKYLVSKADDFFNEVELANLSPKFLTILTKIKECAGNCLVYSNFRTIEGINLFCDVLDYHGFCELDVKKGKDKQWHITNSDEELKNKDMKKYIVFSEDKERSEVLLNIFNSAYDILPATIVKRLTEAKLSDNFRGETAKVFMITRSGAEGISLKGVRQVHIMEPHWNEIRIDQAIGRAVRKMSHSHLKPNERTVDVYSYIMVYTPTQRDNDLVQSRERGETTDEFLLNIARRKKRITNGILQIMKNASVDCLIHQGVHKGEVQCSTIPDNYNEPTHVLYPYSNDYEEDMEDALMKLKLNTVSEDIRVLSFEAKVGSKTIKRFYYELEGVFHWIDGKEWVKSGQRVHIGTVTFSDNKPTFHKGAAQVQQVQQVAPSKDIDINVRSVEKTVGDKVLERFFYTHPDDGVTYWIDPEALKKKDIVHIGTVELGEDGNPKKWRKA